MRFTIAGQHRLLLGLVLICALVSVGCTCTNWMIRAPIEVEVEGGGRRIKDPGTIGVKRNRDVVEWRVKTGVLDIRWSERYPEGYDSPPPAEEISCGGKKCTFIPRAKVGRFKYTIAVTMPEGTPSPPPLDPDVVVMD